MSKGRRKYNPKRGDRFGDLVFIQNTRLAKGSKYYGLFECDCGKVKEMLITKVCSGTYKSCGCKRGRRKVSKFNDATKHYINPRYAEEGLERIKIEIVRQAVKDYRQGVMVYDCERFFKSGWFEALYDCNGEALLNRLQAQREHRAVTLAKAEVMRARKC